MKSVEIVKGLRTSSHTLDTAKDFVLFLGKEPVIVNRDIAGFIVNRINGMALLEALRLLEKGISHTYGFRAPHGSVSIDGHGRIGCGPQCPARHLS